VVVYLGEPNSWPIKERQNVLDRTESYAQASLPVISSLALVLNKHFVGLYGFVNGIRVWNGTVELTDTFLKGTALGYGLLVGLKFGLGFGF
jgi:hypothetical protein